MRLKGLVFLKIAYLRNLYSKLDLCIIHFKPFFKRPKLEYIFTFMFLAIECHHFIFTIEPFIFHIIRCTYLFFFVAVDLVCNWAVFLTFSNWNGSKFCKFISTYIVNLFICFERRCCSMFVYHRHFCNYNYPKYRN